MIGRRGLIGAAFATPFITPADAAFRGAGWGPDRFTSLVFPGAEHNERSWNQRLDVPLTFLLSPRQGVAR